MTKSEFLGANYPLTLSRILDTDEGILWKAEYLDLPVLERYAKTQKEAIYLVEEAREGWYEAAERLGVEIPLPAEQLAMG